MVGPCLQSPINCPILPLCLVSVNLSHQLRQSSSNMGIGVEFSYQSQNITFDEWITLLTLCLAPLIAHIIAGVPVPTYLHNEHPHWHDRICLYNPTSILWRYFAITDRRIRAKPWSPLDMSATNALFWTSHGWDGSEEMIEASQPFCTRKPSNKHIDAISASAVTTVIVTMQGIQPLYELLINKGANYVDTLSIGSIFFPLAIFGLLRLPAALWLTDDYAYRNVEALDASAVMPLATSSETKITAKNAAPLLEAPLTLPLERFYQPHSWRGIMVRSVFLLVVAGLLALGVALMPHNFSTATNFALNLFYVMFLTISLATMAIYILLGRSTTTIIPCISSRWYKIYTCTVFAAVLILITIAALETRRTPCGLYTAHDKSFDGYPALCGRSSMYIQSSGKSTNVPFCWAMRIGEGSISVQTFDGWCQHGVLGPLISYVPGNVSSS